MMLFIVIPIFLNSSGKKANKIDKTNPIHQVFFLKHCIKLSPSHVNKMCLLPCIEFTRTLIYGGSDTIFENR
jgi:hypothetical protein